MIFPRTRQILAGLCLSLLLLTTACAPEEPSRWDQVQQETTQKQPAAQTKTTTAATKPVSGDQFNKFFPQPGGGYERVYTQEKAGFAEAKLKQGGKDVAMLAISDTASNPSAAAKYQQSSKTIAGYPAVETGTTATSVLVSDRYQVKVLSRDPGFTKSDREAWLQKFDLDGLKNLPNTAQKS
ncbi:MAG: hypothetical protein KME12_26645 [Trichocoleus desertorum ATA4-8-CV12]|nr:hypothetical protein [Trichocoleus desertorum ATA4-8-CV12]